MVCNEAGAFSPKYVKPRPFIHDIAPSRDGSGAWAETSELKLRLLMPLTEQGAHAFSRRTDTGENARPQRSAKKVCVMR